MGKRQHQKDKMYITCTEWTTLYGGKRAGPESAEKRDFRRLPFDHCALSLQPFENPLCSPDGHIFDLMYIVPYIKKFKTNPVTGKPLDAKSLIKLKFSKDDQGNFQCPVLYRAFTPNSHIIAIKTTGNVFSYEAVEKLNLKVHNLRELLADEPFTRADIITIQDPSNLDKFNLQNFHHLKNHLKVEDEETKKARLDPMFKLKTVSAEAKDTLTQLSKDYKPPEKDESEVIPRPVPDVFNAAHYSTGKVAASFTSTVLEPQTVQEFDIIDENEVRYKRVKRRGYVQLTTNLGQLNLELYCDSVPYACENFMKHCEQGYYDNTIFHRSIKNFIIQGGDPTGTGTGGKSYFGKPFKDEFRPNLSHAGRGILSMANTGPNSNKSQFFITFRSCKHLDKKHAIFGKVVGGADTLNAMERVPTDPKDKPLDDIVLQSALVFVNPFQEADDQLERERQELKDQQLAVNSASSSKAKDKPKVYGKGVGKYINMSKSKNSNESEAVGALKKSTNCGYKFNNFANW